MDPIKLEDGIVAEDQDDSVRGYYDDDLNLLHDIRMNLDVDSPPTEPADPIASRNVWEPYRRRNTHARLIVKNLTRSVTAEDLEIAFEQYGPVVRVRILENEVTGEPTGSAIIHYRYTHDALQAFTRMRYVDLWFLHPDDDLKARQTVKVGNLPPWARPVHLEDFFDSVGETRTIVMPRGEGEANAGWAAVQFACEGQAQVAIQFAESAPFPGGKLHVEMARLADF